jgi:dihydropteroate synthase
MFKKENDWPPNSRRPTFKLQFGGASLLLGDRTLIMGVVNVTPDSFSDGGLYFDPAKAVDRGLELVAQGADWLDVGGESTRPGSQPVSAAEELRRVLPVIQRLRRRLPKTPISIDTRKAEVAEGAVEAGANILNDVSGLRFDPRLADVARRRQTPLVLMHSRGRPETMQSRPFVKDILLSIRSGFERSIKRAQRAGLRRSLLILDPGLGFGKSRFQNFEILAHLRQLRRFGLPLLIGSSRKSFVQAVAGGALLDSPAVPRAPQCKVHGRGYWPMLENREEPPAPALQLGDAAAVVAAILGGAHIVRVHDVASILPAVRIADAVLAVG